jgi:hypothetical protein
MKGVGVSNTDSHVHMMTGQVQLHEAMGTHGRRSAMRGLMIIRGVLILMAGIMVNGYEL